MLWRRVLDLRRRPARLSEHRCVRRTLRRRSRLLGIVLPRVRSAADEDARREAPAIPERVPASDEADARHSVGICSNGVMRSIARYSAYGSGGATTVDDGTTLMLFSCCAARSASCCLPSARSACGYELRRLKTPFGEPIERPFSNAVTASSNMPNE